MYSIVTCDTRSKMFQACQLLLRFLNHVVVTYELKSLYSYLMLDSWWQSVIEATVCEDDTMKTLYMAVVYLWFSFV